MQSSSAEMNWTIRIRGEVGLGPRTQTTSAKPTANRVPNTGLPARRLAAGTASGDQPTVHLARKLEGKQSLRPRQAAGKILSEARSYLLHPSKVVGQITAVASRKWSDSPHTPQRKWGESLQASRETSCEVDWPLTACWLVVHTLEGPFFSSPLFPLDGSLQRAIPPAVSCCMWLTV